MTCDRKWREAIWEEGMIESQMKDLFIDGSADFFIGFKAKEIPMLMDVFERIGNTHLVDVLKKLQEDCVVGRDRLIVDKEEKECM